ncbi:MAG TPA: class I SAM-dependent rRNA methyltransferase [Paludibacteraceae bacterium]|jgi:23S rRNA (cytosine1962-C5)-methyltransferase|nr:class I SAM-dependent rRNA methyltransferase [Paludibacteraceae bacterium]HOU68847.1 class I SAM-dependent rRNA methyltransferase [Paludibacteraceae bacterium]HPH62139.1 class I SAM-dependent rRNA methyltransferase [Paludibacteraceae bacterium]HQF50618.1 class I SAM-dependent rRNA methyltransferase [Paludibacteraceae bacterium]HQJ90112.1 class I SAM-dependent rRNA methyltransferase [Paludibacteraceae bacterium]
MDFIKIILKPKKEESLKRFHPWVFSGAIQKIVGNPNEGDIVDVYTCNNEYLATGHYQIGSIAVRVFSFEKGNADYNFWKGKIEKAYRLRVALGLAENPNNNTYRLVHGEGDSIPGLIIDIYDQTAVLQAHSIGIHLIREQLAKAIKEVLGDQIKNVFYKSESTLPFKANIQVEDGYLMGECDNECLAMENGLKFHVDWLKGQKTGFFVDQRENRALLETYSKGRSVLNMFCYTGGFSFYAMRGGAKLVHSVDSSAKAIELTKQNVEINFPNDPRHEAYAVDAFKFLDEMSDKQYDLIVLDPPAFAKHRDVLRNALQGYKKLNAKAFEKIKPGGILFTFSCSQAVNKEQFRLAVFSAAAMSGRNVRILHQLTQPADHPVNIYHPEGEYLKGLVLYVE